MICPKCDQDYEEQCECGYRPKSKKEGAHPDDVLTMKSGNKIPRCQWVTKDRCWLPASGQMPGKPRWCHWHQAWERLVGDARTLEDRVERPAFDQWWDGKMAAYGTHSSWGLSKEEYWRYAHGMKIHDPKPESLPVVAGDPAFLTREEFGQDLFAAIEAKAGAVQAAKTARLYTERGLSKLAEQYQHQAESLNHTLLAIFKRNTISPADLKRIQQMQ